jgi:hypothetical protein
LVEVLRKVNPGIVVMPDPRLDAHPDHEFTSVALVQALEQWQGKPIFLLYTNHADSDHYPYGPAGTVVSLPPGEGHISVQKIYSHPTAHALQIRKLFALESMHDLRLSPDEQITCSVTIAHRPDYPRIGTWIIFGALRVRTNCSSYSIKPACARQIKSFLRATMVLKAHVPRSKQIKQA